MYTYSVAFFGHREIDDLRRVEDKLAPILRDILLSNDYVEFYIGRSGEFDEYAASLIKRAKNDVRGDNSSLILVLPYKVKNMGYYADYYDEVMIPDEILGTHPKGAITLRNKWMVSKADLVIVNVERESGGAYTAMKHAQKQGKRIINLAEE